MVTPACYIMRTGILALAACLLQVAVAPAPPLARQKYVEEPREPYSLRRPPPPREYSGKNEFTVGLNTQRPTPYSVCSADSSSACVYMVGKANQYGAERDDLRRLQLSFFELINALKGMSLTKTEYDSLSESLADIKVKEFQKLWQLLEEKSCSPKEACEEVRKKIAKLEDDLIKASRSGNKPFGETTFKMAQIYVDRLKQITTQVTKLAGRGIISTLLGRKTGVLNLHAPLKPTEATDLPKDFNNPGIFNEFHSIPGGRKNDFRGNDYAQRIYEMNKHKKSPQTIKSHPIDIQEMEGEAQLGQQASIKRTQSMGRRSAMKRSSTMKRRK